jgi:hypothetical protein
MGSWNLLEAAAWIANSDDNTVNASQGIKPDPDALEQIKTACASGRLIATGLPSGFEQYSRRQIEPAEWLDCAIDIESAEVFVQTVHSFSFRPTATPEESKLKFVMRIIPKDLVGKRFRYGHTRIMGEILVSRAAIMELWPVNDRTLSLEKSADPIDDSAPSTSIDNASNKRKRHSYKGDEIYTAMRMHNLKFATLGNKALADQLMKRDAGKFAGVSTEALIERVKKARKQKPDDL